MTLAMLTPAGPEAFSATTARRVLLNITADPARPAFVAARFGAAAGFPADQHLAPAERMPAGAGAVLGDAFGVRNPELGAGNDVEQPVSAVRARRDDPRSRVGDQSVFVADEVTDPGPMLLLHHLRIAHTFEDGGGGGG